MYKHTDPQKNYAFLAPGYVIKSYPGASNFPVRLADEVFKRCRVYLSHKQKVNIYDPMCGVGYMLTSICLLNFESIDRIYASDINKDIIPKAKSNLRLLSKSGIGERKREIEKHINLYGKASHSEALIHIKEFERIVSKDKDYLLFLHNVFDDLSRPAGYHTDIIIADLPYGSLTSLIKGNKSESTLDALARLGERDTILTVIRQKENKLKSSEHVQRLEKFKIGKRIVEIFKVQSI